jgi:hypothetical protein
MLIERVLQPNLSHEVGEQSQTWVDLLGARDGFATAQRSTRPVFQGCYV